MRTSVDGKEITFAAIDKAEYPSLKRYLAGKKLKIKVSQVGFPGRFWSDLIC